MSESQYYVLVAIALVGILMQGGLFIYLGGRVDKVVEKMGEIDAHLAALDVRVGNLENRVARLENR